MTVEATVPATAVRSVRQRSPTFGLSWRILALVVTAVMTAEILIFLPSIARFRVVYLEQLIESGTLAALALDATPDNMVTEEVKRSLLNHARVDAVVLVEPNKPKRALMNIEPRPEMPSFNLMDRGALGLIWDALSAMAQDGSRYVRVGGESMRLPGAMVWIVADELPMRIAMYAYAGRILVLSIIIALFTAILLYLGLRWLVIRPLQDLSSAMTAFRRAPEEAGTARAPTRRNDEIGVVHCVGQLVTMRTQDIDHPFTVVNVHLTAVGLDEEALRAKLSHRHVCHTAPVCGRRDDSPSGGRWPFAAPRSPHR